MKRYLFKIRAKFRHRSPGKQGFLSLPFPPASRRLAQQTCGLAHHPLSAFKPRKKWVSRMCPACATRVHPYPRPDTAIAFPDQGAGRTI